MGTAHHTHHFPLVLDLKVARQLSADSAHKAAHPGARPLPLSARTHKEHGEPLTPDVGLNSSIFGCCLADFPICPRISCTTTTKSTNSPSKIRRQVIHELFRRYSKDGILALHIGTWRFTIIGTHKLVKDIFSQGGNSIAYKSFGQFFW